MFPIWQSSLHDGSTPFCTPFFTHTYTPYTNTYCPCLSGISYWLKILISNTLQSKHIWFQKSTLFPWLVPNSRFQISTTTEKIYTHNVSTFRHHYTAYSSFQNWTHKLIQPYYPWTCHVIKSTSAGSMYAHIHIKKSPPCTAPVCGNRKQKNVSTASLLICPLVSVHLNHTEIPLREK